ncbi:uncharacterized protein EV154DRAFT_488328 [Mucor mucedo]|uniref:uncharacterized protein n=1 Tax=Mucor mucedo TaxID=29922 RepID=UPI0022204B57|nr:uncharacterized protein EV154DRAFT_488328 [Mucor mucedo]KAI7867346.1 hypothetical protein EV154DRAFT_488328 [Mucor mucedo]
MQRNTTNYDNGNCYKKFESMTVKSKLVRCVSPTFILKKKWSCSCYYEEIILRLQIKCSLKNHGKISPSYGLSSVMMARKKPFFYKTPENLRHYFNQREDQSRYLNSVILNKERVDSASTLIKELYEKRPLEEANCFLLLPGQTIMPNIQNSKEIHQQDKASLTSKPLPKIMPSQYIYAQNSNMPLNFNYSMQPNDMSPSRLPQNLMPQNLMSQNPMPHNHMPHNHMPKNPMPQNLMNLPLSPSHRTSRTHRLLYSNTPRPTVMCESNPKRKKTRTCAIQ